MCPYADPPCPPKSEGRCVSDSIDHQKRIIFADWLDAMRRGAIDLMSATLARDVVHHGVMPGLVCPDRDAILENVRPRAGNLPPVDARELVAAGDHLVLSARAPGVGIPVDGSDRLRGQASTVFAVRDGKISRMQDYLHRCDALDAVAAAVESAQAGAVNASAVGADCRSF